MQKTQFLNIKLGDIAGPHPELLEMTRVLAGCSHTWCVGNFSKTAVDSLLLLHPMVAQRDETKRYRVIAGFRSYQLAVAHFTASETVRVGVLSGIDGSQARQLALVDILGSPLLLGLGSKPQKQVERLCDALNPYSLEVVHPDLNSSRGIKRLLRGVGHA